MTPILTSKQSLFLMVIYGDKLMMVVLIEILN